jgi:hypothetical protein
LSNGLSKDGKTDYFEYFLKKFNFSIDKVKPWLYIMYETRKETNALIRSVSLITKKWKNQQIQKIDHNTSWFE